MTLFPHDIVLGGEQYIYVLCKGNSGNNGTIYKINFADNRVISSVNFGKNPQNLLQVGDKFFISNAADSFVTVLDLNLNVIRDSIQVGSSPSHLMYALNYVFVSKSSFLTQKSLAAVDIFGFSVTRIFFNSLPISSAVNNGGIYVSTYTSKKVYLLDSLIGGVIDSIYVPSNGTAIGDIFSGSPLKLYVVGGNAGTTFTGREVWRINLLNQPPTVELFGQLSGHRGHKWYRL